MVGIGERMRECVSVLEVEEVQFYCQFCTSNEAGLGEPMSRASAQKKTNNNKGLTSVPLQVLFLKIITSFQVKNHNVWESPVFRFDV